MKILVLQLKRIGDLILTTPALFALREKLPEAHLTLAVEEGCRELLPAIDFVDETLVFRRAGGNGPLWWRLLFHHFDVALDFTGSDRATLFTVLSKAHTRATFASMQRTRMKAMFYNQFVDSSVRENHTIAHYLHLLQAVGIEAPDTPVTLHLPDWAMKKAQQLLLEIGVPGPFALVHPGTARPEKYWLPERWAAVMDYLEHEWKLPCVLTGSSDGAEQKDLAQIKAALRGATARDLSGRLDLLTLAALTQRAQLVLTVDSAPMHLAGAFGTPQIALFGKTNPFHWHPRQEKALVLLAGHSAPNPVFAPRHSRRPMSEISTVMVIDAINALSRNG